MAECILVTEKQYEKGKSVFESIFEKTVDLELCKAPTAESPLAEAVLQHSCRAVIVGVESYTGKLYEALRQTAGPAGALIARFGVGHDGIDKALAKRCGIMVTNAPGTLNQSVAEHTIWLMGACARNIAYGDAAMRRGEFQTRTGVELSGKTLCIIGFGAIGRCVARIAHHGLGMIVHAMDLLPRDKLSVALNKTHEQIRAEFGLVNYTNVAEDILPLADVVSLHLPWVKDTHHFIDEKKLALLKPSAILINTSRGRVIDELPLYTALANHSLSAAGLDVFEEEPYVPMDPKRDLRLLRNVVLTPHAASNTLESNARMATMCLENVRNFFASKTDRMNIVSA